MCSFAKRSATYKGRALPRAPRTTPYVQLSRIRRPPRVGDGKSLIGPGVQDSRLWEEVIGKLRNPLPVRLILLTAYHACRAPAETHTRNRGNLPRRSRSALRALLVGRLCPLVLLRHRFLRCESVRIGVAQHGHRDSLLTRSTINLFRMVAIEFGTWRCVRNGGASGAVTVGNGKFLEQRGATRS